MRCRRCGSDLQNNWGYCPRCGARRDADAFDAFGRDLFSQIFSQMRNSFQDFEELEKGMFEKDIEALDLSPWFRRKQEEGKLRPIQGKGFSVHITSGTGIKPKVTIKTYGDVNRERVEKEVYEKFGAKKPEQGIMFEEPEKAAQPPAKRFPFPGIRKKPVPACTEEPKSDIRRIGDKVTVDICLPGVKSGEDVEIRDLESSVEVKALAGDKAYFKILTKPAQFRISGKSFKDGALRLEFS